MKELMVLVERAVRPVQANGWRKMKMRQELLAHLTAAYEEEVTRVGDAPAALAQAALRFGNPAELTRNLQASVPFIERVLFTPIPGTRWTEGLDRRVAGRPRPVFWTVFWSLVSLALAAPAVGLYLAWPNAPGHIRVIEYIALSGGLTALLPVFVGATCRALAGPWGIAAWLRAAGAALVYALLLFVVPAWGLPSMLEMPVHYGPLAASVVAVHLGLLGLAVICRFQAEAKRRTEEWTKLEIGN